MLVNAPLRDQLSEPTVDGRPDENAGANCAQAALAAILSAPEYLGRAIYGDELKDAAYGQAYTGATDPMVDNDALLRGWGVTVEQERPPTMNDGAWMVARIGAHLRAHVGVLGSIPSQWGSQTNADILRDPSLPTHEVAFCDATYNAAGAVLTLTAMNPWPIPGTAGFYQTQPAAWWAARLTYDRLNPVVKARAVVGNTAGLGQGFIDYLNAHHITAAQVSPGEVHLGGSDPTETFASFADDTVLYYSQAKGVRGDVAAWLVVELYYMLAHERQQHALAIQQATQGEAARDQEIAKLQAQLGAADTRVADLTTANAAADAQVASLTAQVASLTAQIHTLGGQSAAVSQRAADAESAIQAIQKALADLAVAGTTSGAGEESSSSAAEDAAAVGETAEPAAAEEPAEDAAEVAGQAPEAEPEAAPAEAPQE
jgi:hypothetical protein